MKTSHWLRVAAILLIFNTIGHFVGLFVPSKNPAIRTAIEAMQSHRFLAMGADRTFWDFYVGFSIMLGFTLILAAVWCWQLSSLVVVAPERAKPMIGSLCATMIAFAALSWVYLFLAPAVTISAISVCLIFAYLTAPK